MALTPRTQLKRLLIGTGCALLSMVGLILTSDLELQWLFYLISIALVLSVAYAIPGYIGIWLWRMRKFFFNMD